ncbi:hypothetical protein [Gloeothece verrucosa]|uniref:Uncharacterized protein n=1 Tax=Gloeothece verrucosa (strain PCC 7822) TaxID=497965 RepID=E0UNP9_GLOV7|nr:hypothetical protein [Gloeothece verrucosa]ADN18579.1 hypothetical protein Cyan7822_6941 [Gloeothece verrucosa PCC 7822]
MSNLIFPILISLTAFIFVCCFQYRPQPTSFPSEVTKKSKNEHTKSTQPIIPLLPPARKRKHNTTEVIVNNVIIPPAAQTIAYLAPAKVRRHNSRATIINPTLVTDAAQLAQPQLSPNVTLKYLKEYIKEHNLQAFIYERLGKSYRKGKKEELLRVFNR